MTFQYLVNSHLNNYAPLLERAKPILRDFIIGGQVHSDILMHAPVKNTDVNASESFSPTYMTIIPKYGSVLYTSFTLRQCIVAFGRSRQITQSTPSRACIEIPSRLEECNATHLSSLDTLPGAGKVDFF